MNHFREKKMKRTCKQCGKEFELSSGELEFYESKNLELPKRCKECRQEKKIERKKTTAYRPKEKFENNGVKNTYKNTQAKQKIQGNVSENSSKAQSYRTNDKKKTYDENVRKNHSSKSLEVEQKQRENTCKNNDVDVVTPKKGKFNLIKGFVATVVICLFGILGINNVIAPTTNQVEKEYQFRSDEYLNEHFEKHKDEFNYASSEEYLEGANRVISSKDVLHKNEAEDGDDVYFLKVQANLS